MKPERILKYGTALLFLSVLLVYLIPLLKLWGYSISVFDFVGMSSDLNGFLEKYQEYTQYIQSQIAPYQGLCIALVCLPVAEAVGTLCIKEKFVMPAGIAGFVFNNIIGFLLWDKLTGLLDYINGSLVGLLLKEPLAVEKAPIIVWCLIHGLMLACALGCWFLQRKKTHVKVERFDTGGVIFDEIKDKPQPFAAKDVPKDTVVMEDKMEENRFYGVIICEKGTHLGEVVFLEKEERVSLGTEEDDDIFIMGAVEKRSCCLISYDWEQEEYWVQPLDRMTVFLESGQPLGQDRTYCIPRGKAVIIDDEKNQFRLG